MAIGYVYILINAAMPGFLKIGKTDRSSEQRAAELSAVTGVPARFEVAYETKVADNDAVEALIHELFSKHRPSRDREFFCVPLKDAIAALTEFAARFPVPAAPVKESTPASPAKPIWEIVDDDGSTIVKQQRDSANKLFRYSLEERRKAVRNDIPGIGSSLVISKWVGPELSLAEAMAASEANIDGKEPRIYYTMEDGEPAYEFPDGSYRGGKFHAGEAVSEWNELAQKQSWRAAVELAGKIIADYPESSFGYVKKAFALHADGRTEDAKSTLLPAANRFPKNRTVFYNLACYECRLGNLDAAKTWLKMAKEISGKDAIRRLASNDPDLFALRDFINGFVWW